MNAAMLSTVTLVFNIVILLALLGGGALVTVRTSGRRRLYALAGLGAFLLRILVSFLMNLASGGLSSETFFTVFIVRSVFDMLLFLGGLALLLMAMLTPDDKAAPAAAAQPNAGGHAQWSQSHPGPGANPAYAPNAGPGYGQQPPAYHPPAPPAGPPQQAGPPQWGQPQY